jgi:hypothetical protein
MPMDTPQHILAAYGDVRIVATCPGGRAFEKQKVGYCYSDIVAATSKTREEDEE